MRIKLNENFETCVIDRTPTDFTEDIEVTCYNSTLPFDFRMDTVIFALLHILSDQDAIKNVIEKKNMFFILWPNTEPEFYYLISNIMNQ